MATRKVPFIVGEYYHIYNRGVDKRSIFIDKGDYLRFMMLLYLCNGTKSVVMRDIFYQGLPLVEIFNIDRGKQLVDIGVYSLMPNHFHILVRERVDGGISMFIEKLATAYVMYFNTKNERKGSLFEGHFKAKHIDSDEYLNWVFSYIHINPIKLIEPNWKEDGISDPTAVKDFVENYKYSSYSDYFIGDRPESAILNKKEFPEHFSELNDLEDLIQEFREGDY
jgi:putative transposase